MTCPHADDVRAAAASGCWSRELEAHLLDCAWCADEVMVRSFFGRALAQAELLGALPDPQLVWLRATLERRREAVERATRPIALLERVAVVLAAVTAVVAGWLLRGQIAAGFERLVPVWSVPDLPASLGQPGLVLLASGAVLLLAWLADLYGRWAEG